MQKVHIPKSYLFILLGILVGVIAIPQQPAAARDDHYIMVIEADGAIVPAMQGYLERCIEQANDDDAELIIIQLDTPGGGLNTTDEIIQLIRESDVPIVVYVYPRGGMAGSAGAMITMAGHQSAMAPDTIIGAASAINADSSDIDETARRKVENTQLATVRSLTENRSEEARKIAEKMITDAEAYSYKEAYEAGLIDYIANDTNDLIEQMEGQTLMVDDKSVTLQLAGLPIEEKHMNIFEQLLLVLTEPFLVFTLLSLGGLLLVIEFRTPGGFVAGTVGAVFILLSLYGLGILPINIFGLMLIILAFVFFAVEIFLPQSQGAISIVGGVLLIIGGIIMFGETSMQEFGGISTLAIIVLGGTISLASAALFFFAIRQIYGHKEMLGTSGLIGLVGETRNQLAPSGKIYVNGEIWNAESYTGVTIQPRSRVRVVEIENMLLRVEPVSSESNAQ